MPVLPRREVCSRCQRAPVSNGVGGSAGWCCRAGGGCSEHSVLLGWRADPRQLREGCVPPWSSRMGGYNTSALCEG